MSLVAKFWVLAFPIPTIKNRLYFLRIRSTYSTCMYSSNPLSIMPIHVAPSIYNTRRILRNRLCFSAQR